MELIVGSRKITVTDAVMEKYLSGICGGLVELKSSRKLGEGFHNAGFLLVFDVDGVERHLVLRVVRGDTGWGHDYLSDRAGTLLLQHELLNSAVADTVSRSVDVASIMRDGSVVSVGNSAEFLQLVEEIPENCRPYADDFFRMAQDGACTERDLQRCTAAAEYLVKLHSNKKNDPVLYKRHIRDLIGHGEMLMGVADTYPSYETLDFITSEEMEKIEVTAVKWRNRLKMKGHRLSRIHGDYHPFGNIRFSDDNSLSVSDLSREKFGEPADDVSSITMNFIFFSVWHFGERKDPFRRLLTEFFRTYLGETKDHEILSVLAPFYAFRGLVVIHPLYYPEMEYKKRRMIINFIQNVMSSSSFEIEKIDEYLKSN